MRNYPEKVNNLDGCLLYEEGETYICHDQYYCRLIGWSWDLHSKYSNV